MKSKLFFLPLVIFFILFSINTVGAKILSANDMNHQADFIEAKKVPDDIKAPENTEQSPVPEPTSMFLLGTGLLVLAALKSKLSQN